MIAIWCFLSIGLLLGIRPGLSAGCSAICGSRTLTFNECGLLSLTPAHVYNVTFVGDTSQGSNQYWTNNGYCDLGSLARDWSFRFVPEISGLFNINTDGSAFDTTLSIVDCSTGAIRACDDDSGIGTSSSLQVRLEKNRAYAIILDGFSQANQGYFSLALSSISWPPENECPGIDRIVNLPPTSQMDSVLQLYSGATGRSDHFMNFTSCESENGSMKYEGLNSVEVIGSRITAPGNYSFLVCSATASVDAAIRPIVCRNSSTDTMRCPEREVTESLMAGDYVSFVISEFNSSSASDIAYSVYGSLNQTSGSSTWCSNCHTAISDSSDTRTNSPTQAAPRSFTMGYSINPETNSSFLGDVYFFQPAGPEIPFISVCGPLNTVIKIRDCAGHVLFTGSSGIYFPLNITLDRLYVIEIAALTDRDLGMYRVQTVRDLYCDQEQLGADFSEKLTICHPGEVSVYVFVLSLFLMLASMSLASYCLYGNRKEYTRSGAFSVLSLSVLGAIPSLYFVISCHFEPAPGVRDFLVFWITWSAVCTAVLCYQVVAQDWSVVFGEALFFRDDENAVKVRLFIAIIGLCICFSFAIAGFVLLGTVDGVKSQFEFCAVENAACQGLQFGTIIQKVISVRSAGFGANHSVMFENWSQELTYRSITNGETTAMSCDADGLLGFSREFCENTCTYRNGSSMANNGICEDEQVGCSFGSDCNDCGVRVYNVSRRVARCNKSNSIANFWGKSNAFVQTVILPFVYSMIACGLFFAVTVYVSATISNRSYAPSFSSEENLSDEEEAMGQAHGDIQADVVVVPIDENNGQ